MQTTRGTKRTCQNEACGARFYDLMRTPIACPICKTVFTPPPPRVAKPEPAWKTSRNVPRHTIVVPPAVEDAEDSEAPELESEETAEADDTEIAPDKNDIILELDEDDAGVNGVERPVAGDEKG
jgi:uncharacterized protein (TIGR02300 family)